MTDVVLAALAQHDRIASGHEIRWQVALVNNEKITGRIESLGDGDYVMFNRNGPVYFSGEKVVYLLPAAD